MKPKKRRPRDDANRPTTPKTIPPWHAAYAAFREVLPDMPEAQAKHETTHAIAYAAANHTKWFWAGVYGRRVIAQLIGEGKTNKEAARILNLSVKTVETHRANAMDKLGFSSTAELVRYAVRTKLIEP